MKTLHPPHSLDAYLSQAQLWASENPFQFYILMVVGLVLVTFYVKDKF